MLAGLSKRGIFWRESGKSHGSKKHVKQPRPERGKTWGVSGDPTRVLDLLPPPGHCHCVSQCPPFPAGDLNTPKDESPVGRECNWRRYTSGSTSGCVSHGQVQGQISMFQDDTQTREDRSEWVTTPLCLRHCGFFTLPL